MTATRPYQMCGECGVTYATAADMLTAHHNLLVELGGPERAEALTGMSCPACLHDFLYPAEQGLSGDLPAHAAMLAECLRRNGLDPARAVERNVIKLGEEVGEMAGAYLRSTGQARRTGTTEDLHEEVADVILTAFSLAHHLRMDINAVLAAKLRAIHTRGYRTYPAGGGAA
jgi:NTP pyrophosphatase (non-canonical NTP hydrolase)